MLYRLHQENGSLRIEHRGLRPIPLKRLVIAFMALVLTGVVVALTFQDLAPKLSDDWYWRFDWWWRIILVMMLFAGIPAIIAVVCVGTLGWSSGLLRTADWDPQSHTMRIAHYWMLGLLTSRRELKISGIEQIIAYLHFEETEPVDIHLSIQASHADVISFQFQVADVDQPHEGLDVVLVVARSCGLRHYSVDDHDPEMMIVKVSRDPFSGSREVPDATGVARYEFDRTSAGLEAPTRNRATLDPQRYADHKFALVNWQPGREIRFLRAAVPRRATLIVGGIFALLAGGIAYTVISENSVGSALQAAALGAITVGPVAMLIYRLRAPEHEVVIDKSAKLVSHRWGIRRRTYRLDQVDHLRLQGVEQTISRKNSPTVTTYLCRLLLVLTDGKQILLTENDSWASTLDVQRRKLEPLAAAISNELAVPVSRRNHEPSWVSSIFESLAHWILILGLVGLVSFFGWGTWRQGKFRAESRSVVKSLQLQGMTVTQGGLSIGDVNIYGDGLLVEVDNPQFDDSDLTSLLRELEPLGLYALDLSHTSITDSGLQQFVGRSSLFHVNLSGTAISTQAVDILAKTNLASIDIRNTAIRLEHLTPLRQFNPLEVLCLSDDDVTQTDLYVLDAIPRLEAVLINDEQTTKQLLKPLNERHNLSSDMKQVEKLQYLEAHSLKVAGELRFVVD